MLSLIGMVFPLAVHLFMNKSFRNLLLMLSVRPSCFDKKEFNWRQVMFIGHSEQRTQFRELYRSRVQGRCGARVP